MSEKEGVQYQLVARAALTPAQRRDMFRLLTQHFAGVTEDQFDRDLAEKTLALLLQRDERLVGFSTLLAYPAGFEGSQINVIYSGDTIVAPEAWGTSALPRAWLAGVDALRASLPSGRCFWLLLTSGFRTYRFLPVFWREFYPRFNMSTPTETKQLIDQLASERFGMQYYPDKGVVRFNKPQKLRNGLEKVSPGRDQNPHTAFFLNNNPGHMIGDELVCLTELCPENLTAAGRRMVNLRPNELASHHS